MVRAWATEEGGVEHRFMGLVEHDREPAQGVESQAPSPLPGTALPVVNPSLKAAVVRDPDAPLVVELSLDRRREPGITSQLELEIARGAVETVVDYRARKRALRISREARIDALQEPVVGILESLGGRVVYRCRNTHCLTVELRGKVLDQLLTQAPVIVRAELPGVWQDDAVGGVHVVNGSQLSPAIDSGYDGKITGSDIEIAQIESTVPRYANVGFWNGPPASPNPKRLVKRYDCGSSSCTELLGNDTSEDGEHATMVAGLMIGDLRDGQDLNHTTTNARIERSGYAGEARLISLGGNRTTAIDQLPDMDDVRILNMSSTISSPGDPSCLGQTSISTQANEVYENGIAFFKSAGNDGNSTSTDCKIGDPGSAIGVFSVGNHSTSSNYANTGTGEAAVRDNAIASSSSRGGTSTQGAGRTIVGITAYGCRTRTFNLSGTYGWEDSGTPCGTSLSTPTVTAAAANFSDWFMTTHGNLIDNPGILYVNMLLMGDRQGESGFRTTRFDGLWGGGRLQARQFMDSTMDAPWEWASGWSCIDHGEDYSVNMNVSGGPQPLPSDAGYVKAAL
jgi:hypothetical protein